MLNHKQRTTLTSIESDYSVPPDEDKLTSSDIYVTDTSYQTKMNAITLSNTSGHTYPEYNSSTVTYRFTGNVTVSGDPTSSHPLKPGSYYIFVRKNSNFLRYNLTVEDPSSS